MEEDPLGTHDRRRLGLGALYYALSCLSESGSQHIVRVVAKRIVPQTGVRRFLQRLAPSSTEIFFPNVFDPRFRQRLFHILAIEVRQPPRHWERADVEQGCYVMGFQNGNEIVPLARGMSDGVDR